MVQWKQKPKDAKAIAQGKILLNGQPLTYKVPTRDSAFTLRAAISSSPSMRKNSGTLFIHMGFPLEEVLVAQSKLLSPGPSGLLPVSAGCRDTGPRPLSIPGILS